MSKSRWLIGGAIAFAMMIGLAGTGQAAYYDGKQITVIVGLSPGGTTDTFVRSFMKVMEKYVPGKPSIIVKNMSGGSGMKAANFVYETAKPDGLTVYWGPWSPVGQALGDPALRARYDKFEFIGGIGDTRTSYARTDIVDGGMKKPADIAKAKLFSAGGAAPSGSSDIMMRLALAVLGLEYKYVTGYRGNSQVFKAMQQNEVQYGMTSIMSFRTRNAEWIKSGAGMGLFYVAPMDENGHFERNSNITEMPTFQDLYKEIHGKMPSGPQWDAFNWMSHMVSDVTVVGLAPPGTDPAAMAELREGYRGAAKDQGFHDSTVKKFGLPYKLLTQKEGESVLNSLGGVSPAIVATLKETIASGSSGAQSK